MSVNNTNVNIIKLFNLPVENDNHVEINYTFPIEQSQNVYCIMIKDDTKLSRKNDFIAQMENENIKNSKVYTCPVLWAIDDMGEQYTLYNFSYKFIDKTFRWYIEFWFDGILKGGHLEENLIKQKFDRIETIAEYKKPISIEFTYGSIHSVIEPIYVQDEEYEELRKLFGYNDSKKGRFEKKLKITFEGKTMFEEIEKCLWRLSEFAFLCYEDMFFYDTLSVFIGDNSYTLKYYLRTNDYSSRKKSLQTRDGNSSIFCKNAFNRSNFAIFLNFRKESDFIFDVFRTTVYSDTFREDYPLRLSQTLEGLANYLNIADTTKGDTFRMAIHLSLYCNDFIKYYLHTFNDVGVETPV